MKTLKGLGLALITTFTLAGCGGGGDGGGGWGAIAYNSSTGGSYIVTNYPNIGAASSAAISALQGCTAGSCRVVADIPPGQCGSIYVGFLPTFSGPQRYDFGVGIASTRVEAENIANNAAYMKGANTRQGISACNG